MKKRKSIAKCSILVCLLLLCSTGKVQAMEYENTESIQQKVLDIVNGSNEIYGIGAPIAHNIRTTESDPIIESSKFVSGGIDHTHQYIMASALVILNNDIGDSIFNTASNVDLLMSNTDWPDVLGNETDYGTYSGHFYDPDTEKNWLGQSSPTCKTRATSYFNKAVTAYKKGDIESAMEYLGRGTHYVSDANEPHHAANLTALNSNHTVFEKYVDKNRKAYVIKNNTLSDNVYSIAYSSSVNDLVRNAALEAKKLYPLISSSTTFGEAGEACVTNGITSVAQYIYKFARTVGIY